VQGAATRVAVQMTFRRNSENNHYVPFTANILSVMYTIKTTVDLRSMFGYNRNPISGAALQSLWVHLKLKRIGYWSIARSDRTRLMTLRSLGALARLRSHKTIRQAVTNRTVRRTKILKILSYSCCMYTFPCFSLPHLYFLLYASTTPAPLPFRLPFIMQFQTNSPFRKENRLMSPICLSA
jgi:hypothetical protein